MSEGAIGDGDETGDAPVSSGGSTGLAHGDDAIGGAPIPIHPIPGAAAIGGSTSAEGRWSPLQNADSFADCRRSPIGTRTTWRGQHCRDSTYLQPVAEAYWWCGSSTGGPPSLAIRRARSDWNFWPSAVASVS